MALKTARGDEAAAVAAAIARFEAETGAAPTQAPTGVSHWQRAALIEGVGAKEIVQETERGDKWLS
jgi:hypothetical protein